MAKNTIYAVWDEQGNITDSPDKITKVAGRLGLHTMLYANNIGPGDLTEHTSLPCGIPLITKEQVDKAIEGMKRGKDAVDDGLTVDHFKQGGEIVLEKLANIFSERLRTLGAPSMARQYNQHNPDSQEGVWQNA